MILWNSQRLAGHLRMCDQSRQVPFVSRTSLFAEKRDMENEISSYEQQIQDINFSNEAKLNDLDPEQRNEYERLKEENIKLNSDITT